MPHSKSAAKRLKQTEKARFLNKSARSSMKTEIKKVFDAAAAGKIDEARKLAAFAMKRIDKAAKRRAIHPNAANRKKSQVMVAINKAAAPEK